MLHIAYSIRCNLLLHLIDYFLILLQKTFSQPTASSLCNPPQHCHRLSPVTKSSVWTKCNDLKICHFAGWLPQEKEELCSSEYPTHLWIIMFKSSKLYIFSEKGFLKILPLWWTQNYDAQYLTSKSFLLKRGISNSGCSVSRGASSQVRQILRSWIHFTAKAGRKWKWSNGVKISEMGIF